MADDMRNTSEPFQSESLDTARPLIARFEGGPLDGKEHVFFRARPVHMHRVHRNPLQRALRRSPRVAAYGVSAVWWDEGVQQGVYEFIGFNADGVEADPPPVPAQRSPH
jgi:hypothetical protein